MENICLMQSEQLANQCSRWYIIGITEDFEPECDNNGAIQEGSEYSYTVPGGGAAPSGSFCSWRFGIRAVDDGRRRGNTTA